MDISDAIFATPSPASLSEPEQRLSLILDSIVDYAIVMLDPAGFVVSWNTGAERINGYEAEEIIGQHLSRFFGSDDQARCRPAQVLCAATSIGRFEEECWRVRKDGFRFWAHVVMTAQRGSDGKLRGFSEVVRDLTERQIAEDAIQRQAQRQRLMAAFGQFALENPDIDELIIEAVRAVEVGIRPEFCRYLELSSDESTLVQKGGFGWSQPWTHLSVYDPVTETEDQFTIGAHDYVLIDDFEKHPRLHRSPILAQHAIRSGAAVLVWSGKGPYGILGVYSRTEGAFSQESLNFLQSIKNTLAAAIDRRKVEDRLAHLAQFDALTELPNRTVYLDRLWQVLRNADETKHPAGVLFLDVDRFKSVNDKLGHSGGDKLLIHIAQRLSGCLGAKDTVSRLGGDEFAVVLAQMDSAEDAAALANRLLCAIAQPFQIEGQQIHVSASLGISIYPTDGSDPDSLLKNADTAMYRAKEAGRNTYRFFLAEMNVRAAHRAQTESELRGALDRNEFVLHYQPKVRLQDGAISGFEALLRWQHPTRGLVPPIEFVPVLEDMGLIVPVGEWVLETVCQQLRAWQSGGLAPSPIAVNLSARQFEEDDFEQSMRVIQTTMGVMASLLEFELTESMLISDSDEEVRVLRNLKALGFRLSVDDFGTGYSSLAYLKSFPLDALKIDRLFIQDITTTPGDATIALAIINLAHSLKLKVIAEGVETLEQLNFLREHGCDEMQGYYFSKPLDAEQCTRALRENWNLFARSGAMVPQLD